MENVRTGQWVLAFGSPLYENLANTVTAGIVSALNRTSRQLESLNIFSSFIQTDAAVNPGNSGGPLVDLRGNLIGINSAILSRTGGYQGIAFAIPVDVVQNVITQLIDNGKVERGFLGVHFDNVSPALAEALNAPRGAAQIVELTENSPAAKAGLQQGDIITSINDQILLEYLQLRTIIGNMLPGQKVNLGIVRGDEKLSLTVTLGTRPDDLVAVSDRQQTDTESEDIRNLGLILQTISPELLERMQLSDTNLHGVVITDIKQTSSAYQDAELRRGDIITEANRIPVNSVREFEELYQSTDSGSSLFLKILRPIMGTGNTRPFFTALSKP